ncbi:aminoglycoside phosphotransferase (APT) family kinase protein [Nocardia sp. GAS34]|uniref:phosphotransferase family protein n=1 Tax=unclassified Nocardia TaxID=2637762 RepID=UPI003D25956D
MIIHRDTSALGTAAEQQLLTDYGLAGATPLAEGTQARVWALGTDRVLKVYPNPDQQAHLEILAEFYQRLDTSAVSWAVPRIRSVTRHDELLATVEDRIPGTTMDTHARDAEDPQLEQLYLHTVRQLATVRLDPPLGRRRLFPAPADPADTGDWNAFVTALITAKWPAVAPILRQDVPDIDTRLTQLLDRFTGRYDGPEAVVHGDLYPGNILMTDHETVTGVIDFGTFTLIGDPLYDLAAACGFWRMYEPDHHAARDRLLAAAATGLTADERRRLLDYLLIAAVTTCDLYPEPDRPISDTGHYQWAAGILACEPYWNPAS